MKICEMFLSIDGEGLRAGQTCVFIRRSACNLRCSFCDTSYSFSESNAKDMSVEDVVSEVKRISKGCRRVTFTGGEPLYCRTLNDAGEVETLLQHLAFNGFEVNVETNGSIPLEQFKPFVKPLHFLDSFACKSCNPKIANGFFTMDWKSPSSGMNSKMHEPNLKFLDKSDVLKFVVGSQEDLDEMKRVIKSHKIKAQIFASPVFGKIEPKEIVEYIINNELNQVRVQVQLHKIVWDPNERGV